MFDPIAHRLAQPPEEAFPMGTAGQGDIFDDLLCKFDGELFSGAVSFTLQQCKEGLP